MKLVAISQRIDFHKNRGETRDALDQDLCKLIHETGNLPIPVPNSLCAEDDSTSIDKWLKHVSPNAVLLSGGNNIGEFRERDITERALIRYASESSLPILGICRGMQMLACYYGAKLIKAEGHLKTRHKLFGKLHLEVNSYHEFSINSCPKEFTIIAKSKDGNIEGIRHSSLPWEGWMWHPEREKEFSPSDIARLHTLFK